MNRRDYLMLEIKDAAPFLTDAQQEYLADRWSAFFSERHTFTADGDVARAFILDARENGPRDGFEPIHARV